MSRVIGEVSMSLRRTDGKIDEDLIWSRSGVDVFEPSIPWRTFRWRNGQKHYSGTHWSSTMRDHVAYESRLELTRLLYADFDQDVTAVFAQPFLLSTTVDGRRRRHVPDYLVLREKDVPLVVDVKPRHLLSRPKVNFVLGWAREVVLTRGWDFEVWSEPPEAELANLRFLAGYRRDRLFDEDLLAEIRAADLDGATLGDALHAFPRHPDWEGAGRRTAAVVEPALGDWPDDSAVPAARAAWRAGHGGRLRSRRSSSTRRRVRARRR
ncbi:TnsA-like heteromeric transposase endonuclease subunit [Streptomyces sp. NPDC088350]|uniref:TnsA-like heteromeric transposase endonuclease subunit n=1 Tax=Streptomyces sp. NPDC088350 TaxID=3365854 RepID=UPI0037F4CEB5